MAFFQIQANMDSMEIKLVGNMKPESKLICRMLASGTEKDFIESNYGLHLARI